MIGAAQTWTNNSSNVLTVSGSVSKGANPLTVAGTGNTTFSGLVSGNGALTKSGSGVLTLTANNTHSGSTTISEGTLAVSTPENLGSSALTINSAKLRVDAASAFSYTTPVTLSGTGTVEVSNAANTARFGAFSGGGGLTKEGPGTMELNGSSTYSGDTLIKNGTLRLVGDQFSPGLAVKFVQGADSGPISQQNTFNAWLATRQLYLNTTTVAYPSARTRLWYPDYAGHFQDLGFNSTNLPTLSGGQLSDNYSMSMTGKLMINTAGTYQFGLNSDDASMLWIDGVTVVNNNHDQGMEDQNNPENGGGQASGSIALTAGFHDIQIGYYEGDGGTTGSIPLISTITDNGTLVINHSNTMTQGLDFGLISGTGGFIQAGTGKTIFNLANTYAGATLVNAGTLVVNGTLSGSTEVNSGGTLAGSNGTLRSVTVESSGAFSPGSNENPIGSLTVNGDLELKASSNFNVQFDTDGGFVDAITVNGNLTIVTGAVFNVNDIGSAPDGFLNFPNDIITYSGTWNGGTFLGMQDDSIFTSEGVSYLISYDDNDINGLGLHAVTLKIVPEPGAVVSLLGGLGLLLGLRRRRA